MFEHNVILRFDSTVVKNVLINIFKPKFKQPNSSEVRSIQQEYASELS